MSARSPVTWGATVRCFGISPYGRRLAGAALLVALSAIAIIPWASQAVASGIYLAFSWLILVPVLYALRRSPRNIRTQWRLIFLAMALGAVGNTINQGRPGGGGVLDIAASLLLLTAAVSLVVKRGRNDHGGVIDAALASAAIGGLLWLAVLHPRTAGMNLAADQELALGATVLLLCGTLGALIRLVETDRRQTRALRLLLVALALNLAGFVLWARHGSPTREAGVMCFLAAYVALTVVCFDPSMRLLGRPAPPHQERLGPIRLTILGLALSAPALVNAGLSLAGMPVDGLFIVLALLLMVPLVMLRIGLLAANRDRLAAALAHEASHDPLTGALNRRAFTELLAQELLSPHDLTVIFCDIDDFKRVNDRMGHAGGDRLLIEIARRLQSSVREQDTVCRFGGDEFLVLLRECGADRAAEAVNRIHTELTQPLSWLPGLHPGASLGGVVSEAATRHRVDVDALIRGADEAMYSHKQDLRGSGETPEIDRELQIMVW